MWALRCLKTASWAVIIHFSQINTVKVTVRNVTDKPQSTAVVDHQGKNQTRTASRSQYCRFSKWWHHVHTLRRRQRLKSSALSCRREDSSVNLASDRLVCFCGFRSELYVSLELNITHCPQTAVWEPLLTVIRIWEQTKSHWYKNPDHSVGEIKVFALTASFWWRELPRFMFHWGTVSLLLKTGAFICSNIQLFACSLLSPWQPSVQLCRIMGQKHLFYILILFYHFSFSFKSIPKFLSLNHSKAKFLLIFLLCVVFFCLGVLLWLCRVNTCCSDVSLIPLAVSESPPLS